MVKKKQRKPQRPKKRPAAANEGPLSQENGLFPIVGIGTSAGGLEALEQFLKHVPESSGMAFAVIQHLDPTQKGMLPELLQRATAMQVIQVKDRTRVQPNCVYVIPPNKDMSILHGVLHLLAPVAPRGRCLPIDYFFRSLADDRQERSIGVILSGMGSDGTRGLRAIKEKAGAVFVQDPTSAKFDSMPRSAIEAGLADVVATAEKLPGKIIAFLHHVPLITESGVGMEDKAASALDKVFILLRSQTGHDFSLYKKSTVYRRVERRMGVHQIDKIANYVRLLQDNPQELELLFRELLIGVTSFFRDGAAWEQLQTEAIPALLAGRPSGHPLRAWSTGCSTGEEAYSLAIVFREAMERLKPAQNLSLQIFATDLDRDAIDKARQGLYPANIVAEVSPERLKQFFVEEEHGYRVGKEIREMVIFAPQNLVMDPPFTKLDILTCRNLLIYLAPELQKKVLPLLHYCLNPGGILFLGSAETIGTFTDLFAPLKGKSRLYRRMDSALRAEPLEFPHSFGPALPGAMEQPMPQKPTPGIQTHAEQLLLQRYSPAAVLTSDKGDIIFISGRTGKYLEPAAGKANLNVLAMAREGLRYELSGAFQKALRQKDAVTLRNVKVGTNGGTQFVDLTVQAIEEPQALRGMVMVVFSDVATPSETLAPNKKGTPVHNHRLAQVQQELQQAREETHALREGMQTSQEELKSTNEELQSTNEELQSANEELTTSKEEMQSMNEELQTVNHEQQAKMDELSLANSDMRNLMNSTDIATVFLDSNLRLRRFTPQATKIINLIPSDVGRPITDITSGLLYDELSQDAREVLRTLIPSEKQVPTRDKRWFAARIVPYRTLMDKIDGVTITFMDITVTKTLEASLQRTSDTMKNILESISDAFFSLDGNMLVTYFNPAAERMLSRKGAEVLGKAFFDLFPKAKGSIFDEKCRQAAKKKAVLSFETSLAFATAPGLYDVRVYPQDDGISVFFRIISESTTTPGPK